MQVCKDPVVMCASACPITEVKQPHRGVTTSCHGKPNVPKILNLKQEYYCFYGKTGVCWSQIRKILLLVFYNKSSN